MIRQPFNPFLIALTLCLSLTSSIVNSGEQRIISTDAGATDLIFSLALEQSLIAVDVTTQLPKDFKALPNIGYHRNLSAEGLLSLKPTAVIGSEHMGPPPVVNALQHAGVQLVRLPSARTSQQLRSNISELASALKQDEQGTLLLKYLDKQLATLNQQPLKGQKIAFLLSMDSAKLRLAGTGSSGVALIELLGGESVAVFKNYQTVSAESLMAMQPDIILVAGNDQATAVKELLAVNPILLHSPAGLNNDIIAVNSSTLVAGLSVAAVDEALRLVTRLNKQRSNPQQQSQHKLIQQTVAR